MCMFVNFFLCVCESGHTCVRVVRSQLFLILGLVRMRAFSVLDNLEG